MGKDTIFSWRENVWLSYPDANIPKESNGFFESKIFIFVV